MDSKRRGFARGICLGEACFSWYRFGLNEQGVSNCSEVCSNGFLFRVVVNFLCDFTARVGQSWVVRGGASFQESYLSGHYFEDSPRVGGRLIAEPRAVVLKDDGVRVKFRDRVVIDGGVVAVGLQDQVLYFLLLERKAVVRRLWEVPYGVHLSNEVDFQDYARPFSCTARFAALAEALLVLNVTLQASEFEIFVLFLGSFGLFLYRSPPRWFDDGLLLVFTRLLDTFCVLGGLVV